MAIGMPLSCTCWLSKVRGEWDFCFPRGDISGDPPLSASYRKPLSITVHLLAIIQMYNWFCGFLLLERSSLQMSDEPFLSIYLLPLSLLSVRSISLRQAPGMPLSSCLAFVVAAVRVERLLLIGKVPPAYLPARTRAPMPEAAENDLPRFIVVREAGQIVCLGRIVMPRRRCVSRKTVGTCRNVHFLARGSACAHRNFSFFAFTLHLLA